MNGTAKLEHGQEKIAYLKSVFTEFDSLSQRANVPVGIVYLSLLPELSSLQTVRNLAYEHSVTFMDASMKFSELDGRDYTVNVLDSHPNEQAHEIFTESLIETPELGGLLNSLDMIDDQDALEKKTNHEK